MIRKKRILPNFGYIPSYSLIENLFGRLFGVPNLLKRLQADKIMRVLSILDGEFVLDYGCGSGYFSAEFSSLTKNVYAFDIMKHITHHSLSVNRGVKFAYLQNDGGHPTPYQDEFFDKVFLSEVLAMVEDPNVILCEVKRILKENGSCVLVNGTGQSFIKNMISYAHSNRGIVARCLKYKNPNFPENFEKYANFLCKNYGTNRKNFFSKEEIIKLCEDNGFLVEDFDPAPSRFVLNMIYLGQFLKYLKNKPVLKNRFFYLKYIFLKFLDVFGSKKHSDVCLLKIRKSKKDELN